MSVFDDISNSQPAERSDFIAPGTYTGVISKLILKDMNGGKTFVAELRVTESSPKVEGKAANPPGSTVGYVQIVGHSEKIRRDMALGNVKKFILAAFNTTEDKLRPAGYTDENGKKHEQSEFSETIKEVLGDQGQKDQPMRGFAITWETYEKATKKGEPRTYPNFHGVDNTPADVKKRRAQLDNDDAELAEE